MTQPPPLWLMVLTNVGMLVLGYLVASWLSKAVARARDAARDDDLF